MLSRRILVLTFALQLALLVAVIPGVHATTDLAEQHVVALLDDDREVPISDVLNYHCHDVSFPKLSCFTSATDRDQDLAATSFGGALTGVQSLGSGYVIAYVHASYAGSSVILSQDYSNLGNIGWNDVISSYKVYTTSTGAFYQHAGYGGIVKYYCCLTNVTYVGDAYNDIFSAFNLP